LSPFISFGLNDGQQNKEPLKFSDYLVKAEIRDMTIKRMTKRPDNKTHSYSTLRSASKKYGKAGRRKRNKQG
jgi:hypothetical protein